MTTTRICSTCQRAIVFQEVTPEYESSYCPYCRDTIEKLTDYITTLRSELNKTAQLYRDLQDHVKAILT